MRVSPERRDSAGPLIFITGTGRSGTTLLRAILNAHPDVHLSHEANHHLLSHRMLNRWPRLWFAWYARSQAFRAQQFSEADVAGLRARVVAHGTLRDLFLDLMQVRAARHAPGASIIGDKTPGACPDIGRMLRDFPGARIVHMVRHPLDTAASLGAMPWAPASVLLNAWYIRRQDAYARSFAAGMLEVRLEDLMANPEGTLGRVGQYLGLDGLAWQTRLASEVPQWPFQAVRLPIARQAPRPALTATQAALVHRIARPVFERHGYQLPAHESVPGWRLLAECVRELPGVLADVVRMVRVALINAVVPASHRPEGVWMRPHQC